MHKLTTAKRALVISLLSEGTPINATERILKVSKRAILRVIRETGAALQDYMDTHFRDLAVERLAMDEIWQYVGRHGQRMPKREIERGDFWMWTALDSDTKLVFSHLIGNRNQFDCDDFVRDAASRVVGSVQVVSDAWAAYARHIPKYFNQPGMSYATETKVFKDPFDARIFPIKRQRGVQKIVAAERKAQIGSPNLNTASTSHVERFFLSMRQELKRYQRLGLGYSKKLAMHKLATSMFIGIYNLCRPHKGINGLTPAMAAQVTGHRWTIDEVVALTDRFLRAREDAKFARAWDAAHNH